MERVELEKLQVLRKLALTTNDKEEQEKLSNCPDMNTRRNLGFNRNLSREIAEKLMKDVTQNVIYIVSKNQGIYKAFDREVENHKCVTCLEKDFVNCKSCYR